MKKPLSRERVLILQKNAEKRNARGRKSKKKMRRPGDDNDVRLNSPSIVLPERLDLTDNTDIIIAKTDELKGGEMFYLDFNSVKSVSVSAALMLGAELEVRKLRNRMVGLRAYDSEWDENVRNRLLEMGFLNLLKSETQLSQQSKNTQGQEKFVRFLSGSKLKGRDVDQIIMEVEKCFDRGEIAGELRIPLYAGISEAVTNTYQHAYGPNEKGRVLSRWWISASVNRRDEITVVCYDRGLTIPGTIRASESKMMGLLLRLTSNDHEIILAAMKAGRTSTHKQYRGKGLRELMDLIDENRQGTLRVYSGKGMVTYTFKGKNSEESYFSRPLPRKMSGTLVEWSIIPGRMLNKEIAQ